MYEAGHGTAPDHIYARGVPKTPSPDPTSFDKKLCTLIIVEIALCKDLGCDVKFDEKTEKYYYPLIIAALKRCWGRVEFIAFPIGHAGTTLTRTLDHLTAAFSTPAMDHNARTHDYSLFYSLLDSLTDLAQSRLSGIIRNRKRLVDALSDGYRHQSHSLPSLTHHQATHQQGAASYIHPSDAHDTRPGEHIHLFYHVEI
jgi:hypothetical protein